MSSLILLLLILLFHIFTILQLISYFKTLKYNIFSNIISPEAISSNFTSTLSDHLPQCMIVPNVFCNPPSNKINICERDWSKFHQETFILDYFSIDRTVALKLDEENAGTQLNLSLIKLTHY